LISHQTREERFQVRELSEPNKHQQSLNAITFRLQCFVSTFSYHSIKPFELIVDPSSHLCVIQKWGSLLVWWNNSALTSEADFLAEDAWNSDDEGGEEENSQNDEGKDPLEGKGLNEELSNAKGCGQDAEGKANGVVLVCKEEEKSIHQDSPDEDIGHDAGCQALGTGSNGTIPVQSNECPCEWSRCDWDVDKSRVGIVAEVEGGQIEKVDNQNDLGPNEVGANEEHDEREMQEVVENEMASNTSSSLNVGIVTREEVPCVTNLKEEKGEPIKRGD